MSIILLSIFKVSNTGHETGIFASTSAASEESFLVIQKLGFAASEESFVVMHKLNSVICVKKTFDKMWLSTHKESVVTSEHSDVLFLVEMVFRWLSLGVEIVHIFSVSFRSMQCGDCIESMIDLVTSLLRLQLLSNRVWRLFCFDPITRVEEEKS